MSPYPNLTVDTIDAPPIVTAPLDSTQAFVIGETWRGGTDPIEVTSPRDLQRKVERTGVGIPIYDAVDAMLREQVPKVWIGRLLGTTPVNATVGLAGTPSGTSVNVTAKEPGEWANGAVGGLSVEAVNGPAGATERVLIVRRAGVEVARSSAATDRAGLVTFTDLNSYVDITLGPTNTLPVVVGATNLAGGTADLGTITSDSLTAAGLRLSTDLGPGQLLAPYRSTDASNLALLAVARDTDRTAYLEMGEGMSIGALTTSYAALRAAGNGAEGIPRLGGAWSQYASGPGFISGTTRTVPWTVVEAGLTARLERQQGHANVAPAGDFGVPRWARGLTEVYSVNDRETLFEAGGNIVETRLGIPRAATFRTLEDEATSEWAELAHTRLERAVRADAFDVGRSMRHRPIDGQGLMLGEFGGRLRDRLYDRWRRGALFGETASEAYVVDVGPSQNTVDSIAAREVHVGIGLKMSPHAEQVYIELAKVPVGSEV